MRNRPQRPSGERFFKNIFEYALFWFLSLAGRALPRPAAMKLGEWLGTVGGWLIPQRRRIVDRNLQLAFPLMPSVDRKVHMRAIFRNIGLGTMEMLRLDKLEKTDLDLFQVDGLEHLRAAYARQKGVFLLTGHLGFWEAGTFLIPTLGFPVDFVVKPMKNPHIDAHLHRLREHAGGNCINSRHGARAILRSLSAGRGVAVLLDQHVSPRQGVEVTFFGRKAYTTPVIAEMAIRYGVPIVPIFSWRTADHRYLAVVEPMIAPERTMDVAALTQILTDRIELAIRRDIDQWFWLHRRWR